MICGEDLGAFCLTYRHRSKEDDSIMDLHFTVSPHEVDSAHPLQVSIIGSRLIVSGFASNRKVTFEGEFEDVSIKLEPGHFPTSQKSPVPEVPVVAQPETVAGVAPIAPQKVSPPVTAEKPALSLFEQLAALRKQISSETKTPPYIIFHDSTLKEMCRLLPSDLQELKDIHGVGESKLEKYGKRFIEVIGKYAALYGREGVE
jgi:ATP-dependent DNA helicase RecQ